MSFPRSLRTAGVALTAVALGALTACGGGESPGGAEADSGAKGAAPKAQKVQSIADALPKAIRDKGTLSVVMSTSSPPAHFESDGGVMQGSDVDLANVLGQVFGVKVKVVGAPLDGIIPGVQAKRYDVVVSQFSPTPERAKVVDLVNYAKSGTQLGVKGGNPKKLSPSTLCGVKIAVQKGSSQTVDIVPNLNKKCQAAGKPEVAMQTFKDSSAAMLALRSSRVDGVLLDSPVVGYAIKQAKGQLAAAGTLEDNPVSIATLKDNGLAEPIKKALEQLQKDGTYAKVLQRWGLESTALPAGQFVINDIKGD